ncbi:MAG: transposase, partial [Lentisphaeria bacterium]|nr:transposase [Lentisphaeria bacterium]
SKRQTKLKELTLLVNDYVIIITTLQREAFPLKSILEIYRLRWQIELVFKRFKSIARLGALPKYTDSSARAWLYGKMLVALIIEKLCAQLGAFSPWRHAIGEAGGTELVDRIQILAAQPCQMADALFWDEFTDGELENDL